MCHCARPSEGAATASGATASGARGRPTFSAMLFQTPRLTVRHLALGDAPFILALQTEEAWLSHIGSRGVRDLASAHAYLEHGPLASYAAHGFGLYHVALRATDEPIGVCGILKREELDAPDLGYGFLTAHHGRGYATEAARGTLAHARTDLARIDPPARPRPRASRRHYGPGQSGLAARAGKGRDAPPGPRGCAGIRRPPRALLHVTPEAQPTRSLWRGDQTHRGPPRIASRAGREVYSRQRLTCSPKALASRRPCRSRPQRGGRPWSRRRGGIPGPRRRCSGWRSRC